MKENYIRLIDFFLKNPMCLNILYREVGDGSYMTISYVYLVTAVMEFKSQQKTNGKTAASLSQEHKFFYVYKFFLEDNEKSF